MTTLNTFWSLSEISGILNHTLAIYLPNNRKLWKYFYFIYFLWAYDKTQHVPLLSWTQLFFFRMHSGTNKANSDCLYVLIHQVLHDVNDKTPLPYQSKYKRGLQRWVTDTTAHQPTIKHGQGMYDLISVALHYITFI